MKHQSSCQRKGKKELSQTSSDPDGLHQVLLSTAVVW